MCDVCASLGLNPEFVNGDRMQEKRTPFYGFSNEANTFKVTVCYVHEIELFFMGECRFLRKYPLVKLTKKE